MVQVAQHINRATKTTTYVIVDESLILADTSGGDWTLTLPPAANYMDQRIHIKKITSDSNTLTIDGDSSETIDDQTTAVITVQYVCLTVVSDGTEWWIT